PEFWRGISARPAFDRITEPVLMVHGRYDDTCPPRWARATQRALTSAGVDSTLRWYDDGHAFGPAFDAAMDRTATFLLARMPGCSPLAACYGRRVSAPLRGHHRSPQTGRQLVTAARASPNFPHQ